MQQKMAQQKVKVIELCKFHLFKSTMILMI